MIKTKKLSAYTPSYIQSINFKPKKMEAFLSSSSVRQAVEANFKQILKSLLTYPENSRLPEIYDFNQKTRTTSVEDNLERLGKVRKLTPEKVTDWHKAVMAQLEAKLPALVLQWVDIAFCEGYPGNFNEWLEDNDILSEWYRETVQAASFAKYMKAYLPILSKEYEVGKAHAVIQKKLKVSEAIRKMPLREIEEAAKAKGYALVPIVPSSSSDPFPPPAAKKVAAKKAKSKPLRNSSDPFPPPGPF